MVTSRTQEEQRRMITEKCERFVTEECILSPKAAMCSVEFVMRLHTYLFPHDDAYDPKILERNEFPPLRWWKDRFGLSVPSCISPWNYIEGIAPQNEYTKRVEVLERRMEEIYWAPGMPGYFQSRGHFENAAREL